MSDPIPDDPVPDDFSADELLAAEYALRVLDAEAMLAARGREADDPEFAALVAGWQARLAPMLDAAAAVEPDGAMWNRIAAAVAMRGVGGDVVALRGKLRFWRGAATGLTAVAASLALFVAASRLNEAAPPAPAGTVEPTRFAALVPAGGAPEGGAPAVVVVSYDPVGRSLVVTPAALTPAPARDYELWVVPADGRPRSLGVLAAGPPRRIALADDLAAAFAGAPTLAVSQEASGGSRTGSPVGPIVASGKLLAI